MKSSFTEADLMVRQFARGTAEQVLRDLVKRIEFTGLFSAADPQLEVSWHGQDLRVSLVVTVPNRDDPKQRIRIATSHGFSVEEVLYDRTMVGESLLLRRLEDWLLEFWRHEFYESVKLDGKFLRNQH